MGLLSTIGKKIAEWIVGTNEPSRSVEQAPVAEKRSIESVAKYSPLPPPDTTNPSLSQVRSKDDLITWARANPEKLDLFISQYPRAQVLKSVINQPRALEQVQRKPIELSNIVEEFDFDRDKFESVVFSDKTAIPPVIELKLKNGMKVIISPDNSTNKFNMKTVYSVGSKDDKIPGTAHFLEHILAGRAPTESFRAGENWDIVEYNGGRVNAATETDATWYDLTLPAEFLELAFKIEQERMQSSDLDAVKDILPTEKSVIEAEIKRYDDDKSHTVTQELGKMFHGGTCYENPILGTVESVNSIKIRDLKNLYSMYQDPKNLTLVISGNVGDPGRFQHLLMQYFGSVEAKPQTPKPIEPRKQNLPVGRQKTETTILSPGDDKVLGLCYSGPGPSDPDYPIMEILSHALFRDSNSLFNKKLGADKGIDFNGFCYPGINRGASSINLVMETDKFVDLDELKKEVKKLFQSIADNGLDEELLRHIKLLYLANQYHELENQASKALTLAIFDRKGKWQDYTELVPKLQKITNNDIRKFVKKYFLNGQEFTVQLKPSGEEESRSYGNKSADFKIKHPASDPARLRKLTDAICAKAELDAPDVKVSRFDDGNTRVVLHESHRLPLFEMTVLGMRDTTENHRQRLANQILSVLLQQSGTAKYNRDQLGNKAKELGARIVPSVDQEKFVLNCATTSHGDNLAQFADLLEQILLHPKIDVENFTKAKEMVKHIIKTENVEAESLLDAELGKQLYKDHNHPFYTGPREERWQIVDSISYAEVVKAWENLRVSDFVLGISGDVDEQQVKQYLTPILKKLGAKSRAQVPDIDIAHRDDIQELEDYEFKGEQEQAHLVYAQDCQVNQMHPDFYSLVLGDTILGANSISSRLGRVIRENKGLVYDLGSSLKLGIKQGGQFVVEASGKKANASKLQDAIEEAIKDFPDDISQEELEMAKQSLINSYYANNFTNNAARAQSLAALEIKGRGMDFVRDFAAMINDISLDQVKAALKQHIDFSNLVKVVVAEDIKVNGQEVNTVFDAKKYKLEHSELVAA